MTLASITEERRSERMQQASRQSHLGFARRAISASSAENAVWFSFKVRFLWERRNTSVCKHWLYCRI